MPWQISDWNDKEMIYDCNLLCTIRALEDFTEIWNWAKLHDKAFNIPTTLMTKWATYKKDWFPVTAQFHFLSHLYLVRKWEYSYVVGRRPDAVGFASQEHTSACLTGYVCLAGRAGEPTMHLGTPVKCSTRVKIRLTNSLILRNH